MTVEWGSADGEWEYHTTINHLDYILKLEEMGWAFYNTSDNGRAVTMRRPLSVGAEEDINALTALARDYVDQAYEARVKMVEYHTKSYEQEKLANSYDQKFEECRKKIAELRATE